MVLMFKITITQKRVKMINVIINVIFVIVVIVIVIIIVIVVVIDITIDVIISVIVTIIVTVIVIDILGEVCFLPDLLHKAGHENLLRDIRKNMSFFLNTCIKFFLPNG